MRGVHRLRVYAVDEAGNVSSDSFFDVFVDLTRPGLENVTGVGAAVVTVSVSEFTLVFTERIDPGTFRLEDLSFTRGGVPLEPAELTGVGLVQDNDTTWRVTGLDSATGPLGDYVLHDRPAGHRGPRGQHWRRAVPRLVDPRQRAWPRSATMSGTTPSTTGRKTSLRSVPKEWPSSST